MVGPHEALKGDRGWTYGDVKAGNPCMLAEMISRSEIS